MVFHFLIFKIHKALEDETPSFCPIFPLKALTSNDCTIKNSFSFAKEVLQFDASFFMASFEIKVTFHQYTSSNFCVQNVYRNQTYVGNLTKSSFYNLFRITMFESFLIFDWKFYERCDGVVMGSP